MQVEADLKFQIQELKNSKEAIKQMILNNAQFKEIESELSQVLSFVFHQQKAGLSLDTMPVHMQESQRNILRGLFGDEIFYGWFKNNGHVRELESQAAKGDRYVRDLESRLESGRNFMEQVLVELELKSFDSNDSNDLGAVKRLIKEFLGAFYPRKDEGRGREETVELDETYLQMLHIQSKSIEHFLKTQ